MSTTTDQQIAAAIRESREKLELVKQLEEKKASELRAEIVGIVETQFDNLAALCGTKRKGDVYVGDANELYHNVYSALQFGRGPKAYDFASMQCDNGMEIALVAAPQPTLVGFAVRSEMFDEIFLGAFYKQGRELDPEVAFQEWIEFEAATKTKDIGHQLREIADTIVHHPFFSRVGITDTRYIVKPQTRTKIEYYYSDHNVKLT